MRIAWHTDDPPKEEEEYLDDCDWEDYEDFEDDCECGCCDCEEDFVEEVLDTEE